jgi:hypothetical protein
MSEGVPKSQYHEEIESSVRMTFEEAEHLFGEDFLGPREVEQVFGSMSETIPDIPFSKEELERAKELGQQLIFYTDKMNVMTDGHETVAPITIKNLKEKFSSAHDGNPMISSGVEARVEDEHDKPSFCTKQKPRKGWRLTSPNVIPKTAGTIWLKEQTETLIKYLKDNVFEGGTMPREYQDAIAEFEAQERKLAELQTLVTEDDYGYDKLMEGINKLAITKLCRESPVEVVYRLVLNDQVRQEKQLPATYISTNRRYDSIAHIVLVGAFDNKGIHIDFVGNIVDRIGNKLIRRDSIAETKSGGTCLSRGKE